MTARGDRYVRHILVFLLCLPCALCLSCAVPSEQGALAPPVAAEPVQDIPTDLDIVVRVDVRRLRAALPPALLGALLDAFVDSFALRPFRAVIERSDAFWFAMRPVADPAHRSADYVLVLDGELGRDTARDWQEAFFSPRDLGGAFFRHDAKTSAQRIQPGRVYEQLGERLVIASAAEVDAVERVIEGHHRERGLVPPEQGAVSLSVNIARMSVYLSQQSPKLSTFLAAAEFATGYIDVKAESVELSGRLRFVSQDDAARADRGLALFSSAIDLEGNSYVKVHANQVERDLVVSLNMQMPFVLSWLGLL